MIESRDRQARAAGSTEQCSPLCNGVIKIRCQLKARRHTMWYRKLSMEFSKLNFRITLEDGALHYDVIMMMMIIHPPHRGWTCTEHLFSTTMKFLFTRSWTCVLCQPCTTMSICFYVWTFLEKGHDFREFYYYFCTLLFWWYCLYFISFFSSYHHSIFSYLSPLFLQLFLCCTDLDVIRVA